MPDAPGPAAAHDVNPDVTSDVTLDVTPSAMVAGGDAIARDDDGRVVFVSGALPGERVRAMVTEVRRDFARAAVAHVLDPSSDRVEPPCPEVRAGCGGCGWQHIEVAAQRRFKLAIVEDALRRLGRLAAPDVRMGPDLPDTAYRTTARCAVVDGKAGFRRARSHDALAVRGCLVAHPLIDELVRAGSYRGAAEVTLRAGAATGERLVLADPSGAGVVVPDGVEVVGADELARGRRAHIHEVLGERRWQISARSFFQARPDGAAALVELVQAALAGGLDPHSTVADLYAGVGLFGGCLAGASGARLIAVERGASAVRDARHNLADLRARVVRADVERWRPSRGRKTVRIDAVVADPARTGLGRRGADTIAATGAPSVVLVSCDAAALGRDTALLAERGYSFRHGTVVDLFPHTPHVEVVALFSANVRNRRHPDNPPAANRGG